MEKHAITVTVKRVERELDIPKGELIKEGIRTYLEFELRSLKAEMSKPSLEKAVKKPSS